MLEYNIKLFKINISYERDITMSKRKKTIANTLCIHRKQFGNEKIMLSIGIFGQLRSIFICVWLLHNNPNNAKCFCVNF